MTTNSPVLISWVAVNNDPYEPNKGSPPVPGPTFTLLFDESSQYKDRVRDVVLLRREEAGQGGDRERRATEDLEKAIREQSSDTKIRVELWKSEDPTDHHAILEFLRKLMPEIRNRYPARELVIHVSPGTPSMQTIWILMGTTGLIEAPFQLVKSYRERERRGRPAVVPVELNIETFLKAYRAAEPRQVASEEQGLLWDPKDFRTEVMQRLFAEARRFAQIKVPVLLLGERGTGKTTLARWLRINSPFRNKNIDQGWPAVACGQYTSELLRSELFGYVKGAFTGAHKDTDGLLVKADGDTLFLDEIGDLSRDNQRQLIKALEEKVYYRVGDTEPRRSDFRLLTATNLNMDELQERLDPDFFDRISPLRLCLPPLREIADELHWLWPRAYQSAITRAGADKRRAQFAQSHHDHIVAKLKRHPLPGNMRDLFRVAYRILAARNDADDPLAPEDAVAYGLQALNDSAATSSAVNISQSVARAFADNAPLNALVEEGPLDTKAVERDLKQYIADEIRRIAKDTERPIDQLCDQTDRTLRSWSKPKGKVSSESRNNKSEK